MIFDDHDVHDDWNTSIDWVQMMRGTGWWDRRIEGGFISYLIYQHWGNLSPRGAGGGRDVPARQGRGGRRPHRGAAGDFAYRADREVEGTRWSYYRDIGRRGS